jgi:hypothetical protein
MKLEFHFISQWFYLKSCSTYWLCSFHIVFFLLHPFRLSLVLFSLCVVFPYIVILLFISFFWYSLCAITLFLLCSRYLATIFTLLHFSFCVCTTLLLYWHYYIFIVVFLRCSFFSCCCITLLVLLPLSLHLCITLFMLHCYSFPIVALFFSRCLYYFSHDALVVFLKLSHCSFHATLILFSHWCYQSSSTYLPNSWCCFSCVIVVVILFALVLMLFLWLVWYFPSPSCHV